MKIRNPTNCGITYQISSCASTIETSDREPAIMIAPSSARPIEISYEISCAAERIAPRKLYLEPEAQPPSSSP